jgi:hypothetical protein
LGVAAWSLRSLLVGATAPGQVSYTALESRLSLMGFAALVLVITGVLAGGLFIWWFHRAYKNLASLGATGLRYGAGWAIGGWFIPLANLVLPKRIANDLWRASDPALPAKSGSRLAVGSGSFSLQLVVGLVDRVVDPVLG